MAHKIPSGASDDRRIAAIAAGQHGHVSRRQLLDAGLSTDGIGRRVRAGSLIRVHAGVYAVGCLPTEPAARAAAAVLACGPAAALSHDSAATLWEMRRDWTEPAEVTVATHRARPGLRIHRCTSSNAVTSPTSAASG
jgi:predicted transcriptional regulator of viral defense system